VTPLVQLYRDAHLVVVSKPSGLLTHRGWGRDRDTALSRTRDMVGAKVHLPHRLDRATSGALLVALDLETQRALAHDFEHGRVKKSYLALVRGHAPERGCIDHAIRLPDRPPEVRVDAHTHFWRVGDSRVERCSLLRVQPLSGRPHQIRRHLKHIDHPIVGDTRYGDGKVNRHFRETWQLQRLALHAERIAFRHPITGEALDVEAPLPDDLRDVLERLGVLAATTTADDHASSAR
jgi:tRNA pseudouridine65 synthase